MTKPREGKIQDLSRGRLVAQVSMTKHAFYFGGGKHILALMLESASCSKIMKHE
jgi:hypothetical protein